MRCPRCFTCPIKTGKNRNCRFYILNVWILPANFGIVLSLVCRFHFQSFVQYGSLVYENIPYQFRITHKNNWSKFLLGIPGTIKFDWNILAQTPEKVSLNEFFEFPRTGVWRILDFDQMHAIKMIKYRLKTKRATNLVTYLKLFNALTNGK